MSPRLAGRVQSASRLLEEKQVKRLISLKSALPRLTAGFLQTLVVASSFHGDGTLNCFLSGTLLRDALALLGASRLTKVNAVRSSSPLTSPQRPRNCHICERIRLFTDGGVRKNGCGSKGGGGGGGGGLGFPLLPEPLTYAVSLILRAVHPHSS